MPTHPVIPTSPVSYSMSYALTLRPKANSPLCPDSLRQQLLAAGLTHHEDPASQAWLRDDLAHFEIVADAAIPSGLCVVVRIPYHQEISHVTRELLNLERLSEVIDADLFDGDEMMVHDGWAGLDSLFAMFERYERAAVAVSPPDC